MVKDPVCKMQVDERTARFFASHEEQTYHFCSKGCQETFEADPHKFLQDTDVLGRKIAPS